MRRYIDAYMTPDADRASYRLFQLALVVGGAIAVLGILHHSDLLGLAGLVTAIIGPVVGARAYGDVGAAKWAPAEPPHKPATLKKGAPQ